MNENGTVEWLDATENARLAVELDPERLRRETETWRAGNRLWRAIMLAPDLETLDALLAGEAVPLNRLDPEWVRRLGLRSPVT